MDRTRASDDSVKSRRSPFKELDGVALAAPIYVTAIARELPAGARGAVVGAWRHGDAFDVEFTRPFECIVTVRSEGLVA
jgi:hypothetical protein